MTIYSKLVDIINPNAPAFSKGKFNPLTVQLTSKFTNKRV